MTNFMAQFDTVANSEAGSKLHFKLGGGELAYLDAGKEDKDGNELDPVKPVTVTMQGSASDAHKKHAVSEIRKLRIKAKKSHGKKQKEEDIPDSFFDDTAEAQVKRLVAVVTSWENMLDDKGGLLECTADNVNLVFTKYQALRVQATNFLDDDVNFIKS